MCFRNVTKLKGFCLLRMLIKVGKLIVALAASWAIGASFYVFFSPISGQGVTSGGSRGSGVIVETFITEQSWYEAQGLWGDFVLLVFAAVYLVAVRLAWRSNFIALAILSLITVALSVITGFSIGGIYLPAALALFIGALIFLSSKLLRSR